MFPSQLKTSRSRSHRLVTITIAHLDNNVSIMIGNQLAETEALAFTSAKASAQSQSEKGSDTDNNFKT